MSKKTANDIQGIEYDWLACDGKGHLGFLSTAGAGYAPEEFLRDTDAHDAAIEAILSSPPTTTATCLRELAPGLRNTWKLMAERGIFSFDSDPNGGAYQRIAYPTTPALLLSFRHLEELLNALRYAGLDFAQMRQVTETDLRLRPVNGRIDAVAISKTDVV